MAGPEGFLHEQHSRRDFLRVVGPLAAISVIAPGILVACGGDGPEVPGDSPSTTAGGSLGIEGSGSTLATTSPTEMSLSVYVPDYLEPQQYDAYGKLAAGHVTDSIIAFAIPGYDGTLIEPNLNDGLLAVVRDTKTILSIGGWSYGDNKDPDKNHQEMLDRWAGSLTQPERFADSVGQMVENVRAKGLNLTGIDFDFEFPSSSQSDPFAELAMRVREAVPDLEIGIAVPHNPEGLGYAGILSSGVLRRINIMAYDKTAGSLVAGHHAAGSDTLGAVEIWDNISANDVELHVGLPTYGYIIDGAQKIGDTGTIQSRAQLKDVDPAHLTDQSDVLATEYNGPNQWGTFLSPAMAKEVLGRARGKSSKVVGGFWWSAEGMTDEDFTVTQVDSQTADTSPETESKVTIPSFEAHPAISDGLGRGETAWKPKGFIVDANGKPVENPMAVALSMNTHRGEVELDETKSRLKRMIEAGVLPETAEAFNGAYVHLSFKGKEVIAQLQGTSTDEFDENLIDDRADPDYRANMLVSGEAAAQLGYGEASKENITARFMALSEVPQEIRTAFAEPGRNYWDGQ